MKIDISDMTELCEWLASDEALDIDLQRALICAGVSALSHLRIVPDNVIEENRLHIAVMMAKTQVLQ